MSITKHYDLGLKSLVKYRPYTEDESIIRNILIDRSEYQLFVGANPRVIYDVGANIGAASLLFLTSYPDAIIFAFEPDPENYEILVENVKDYKRVQTYNFALGARTEGRTLFHSDDEYNHGGHSFHKPGTDPTKSKTVPVVDVLEFTKDHFEPDMMKVDTEGCEFEILSRVAKLPRYIMGECHGQDDYKMFDLLSATHDLKFQKEFGQRCFPFYAKRRDPS
jgi:FkbM family methyltransferase